jgi:S1/P1 Nuclease
MLLPTKVPEASLFRRVSILGLALLGSIVFSSPGGAWFAEGHQIAAIIAADNLTPVARSHVARILGVRNGAIAVSEAMAAASIRPDTVFRADRTTIPWHFIDICLQDAERDIPARCPDGDCVTMKIDEYTRRLRHRDYDKWGAAGDLAFLIHFVADIHQPLHTATDGDRGGTCQAVEVVPPEKNLHLVWDDAVVVVLEKQLGTAAPEATARKLEVLYAHAANSFKWRPGSSNQIAWQSHEIAKTEIYDALRVPERPCTLDQCDPATRTPVALTATYMQHAAQIAGQQLAEAGYQLAALLNEIWSRNGPR